MIKELTQSHLGPIWYHSESTDWVPLIQKLFVTCLGTVVGSQSLDRQTDIWRKGETFKISNEIHIMPHNIYLLDKILASATAILQQIVYIWRSLKIMMCAPSARISAGISQEVPRKHLGSPQEAPKSPKKPQEASMHGDFLQNSH